MSSISIGDTFSHLTVIAIIPRYPFSDCKRTGFKCRCVCGNELVLRAKSLTSGNTKSCGCYKVAKMLNNVLSTSHGQSYTSLYNVWHKMLDRCQNPLAKDHKNYGGRGIAVCKRWFKFENFMNDMGDKPNPDHEIDRIDVNGDYEPTNCRWATPKENANNRRNNHRVVFRGELKTLAEIVDATGINRSTLRTRLQTGMTADEATSVAVRRWARK